MNFETTGKAVSARAERVPGYSFLLPLMILLAGILITLAVVQLVRKQDEEKLRIEFELLLGHATEAIQDRITANEQTLRAVVGLFSARRQAGKPVTRSEFRSFVASLNLDERYPGIQGVGFSKLILPSQLGDHQRALRAEGFPDYAVRPPGERATYSSIINLEPFDWRNQRAFGYDMYSEPVRRRAMERAWKTGSGALSGRVTLVQETDKEVQPGVLLYVPIYRSGVTPGTDALRADDLVGWAYSPLRMKDMMSSLIKTELKNLDGRVAFSLHDGDEAGPGNLLFEMEGANSGVRGSLQSHRKIEVGGQTWLLAASTLPGLGETSGGTKSGAIAAAGLLISLLLAATAMILLRGRARDSLMIERLAASEQRFRTLADNGAALIWTSDLDKRADYFNTPWLRFTGRSLQQELGDGWVKGVHPEDHDRCLQTYVTAFDQHHAFSMDYRLRHAEGDYRWIRDEGVPRYDSQGNFIGYIGYCFDIDKTRKLEAELDAHRSHLERLVTERTDQLVRQKYFLEDLIATLPCGVYRLRHKAPATAAEWGDVDHPPHVQDLTSDTFCRLLGISREEAEATQGGVIARIHPDDLGEFLKRVEVSNTALTPFVWEGRMRVGGETKWMRFDAIPRRVGDEIVVSGILQDISERKQHSSLIYRSVVEASPDAFVAIDENDRIIEWSPQAEALFGYPEAEAIGMQLSDTIIPPPHVAEHRLHLNQFVAGERGGTTSQRRRTTARRRNGTELPVELQIMSLQLDGHWRFTSFIRDISYVVAAEERLAHAQKLEAIGQLTGGLAHDFNNLLGIIAGNLDLLREGVTPEEQIQLIDAASSAASRGIGVTKSLLAVARRSSMDPAQTNINVLLRELEPLLRQTAGRRIDVMVSPHAEHAEVVIDSSAFGNALLNLVINARDAMPTGGELLIFSYSMAVGQPSSDDPEWEDLPEGHYVVVGVDDQGCGMEKETLNRAFEPFFTTKKRGKGTGLGLPMVSAFATRSGGRARIESTPGKGSSVQIILPVSFASKEKGSTELPLPVASSMQANGRILLVDDEIDLLKLSRRWLTHSGYQVDTADNAEAALAVLASRWIDLMVTDIVMPGELEGLALARIAATRYPDMKIILISGYPENITEDDRRRWGLVEKPFSRSALISAVVEALGPGRSSEH